MAPHLDDPSLVEGQRAEAASAETSAAAGQAEPDLRDRRDASRLLLGRMISPHVGKPVDVVHLRL